MLPDHVSGARLANLFMIVSVHVACVLSASVARADDCNTNGIPDECDIDCGPPGGECDTNGCGQSEDSNTNGVPDECDLAVGISTNGLIDETSVPDPTLAVGPEHIVRRKDVGTQAALVIGHPPPGLDWMCVTWLTMCNPRRVLVLK